MCRPLYRSAQDQKDGLTCTSRFANPPLWYTGRAASPYFKYVLYGVKQTMSKTNNGINNLVFRFHELHRQHVDIQFAKDIVDESTSSLTIHYTPAKCVLQHRVAQVHADIVYIIRWSHHPRIESASSARLNPTPHEVLEA